MATEPVSNSSVIAWQSYLQTRRGASVGTAGNEPATPGSSDKVTSVLTPELRAVSCAE